MSSLDPAPFEPTPVSQQDFLDEDPPIRAQNFVCLSFVSPEEILRTKEIYLFNKYLEGLSVSLKTTIDTLKEKYPADVGLLNVLQENNQHFFDADALQEHYNFFKGINAESLEKEFHEENRFQTSIRGIKVRGVYDTMAEAENRVKFLKNRGDKFDIYVGTVGCWCPWNPSPEEIPNQEHSNNALNELMKRYKENAEKRDAMYEFRKNDKINSVKLKHEPEDVNQIVDAPPTSTLEQITEQLENSGVNK